MNEVLYYDLKEASGLTQSFATDLACVLGRQIVSGEYRPGDLIEDEQTLAERHNVSRSVLRDGVKILVGKGLLEVRRGIGTRVRDRANWALLDNDVLAWHQSAPPRREFLNQLTELRSVIEPKAARWAAERATQSDIDEILVAQTQMECEEGSVKEFVIADALFHRSILRAANNEFLEAMEGVIYSALLSSIQLTTRDQSHNAKTIASHRLVYQAIADRDPDRAEAAMIDLLNVAKTRIKTEMKFI